MSHIIEMIEKMESYSTYLIGKLEKFEFDNEFEIIFNNTIDIYVEIYRFMLEDPTLYPNILFDNFSETLVRLVDLFNENRVSEAIYCFLEDFNPQLYQIKAVVMLHTYRFSLYHQSDNVVLTISDRSQVVDNTLIPFNKFKDIEYDYVNISCKDYKQVQVALVCIGVDRNKILPSSYPHKNSIETFRPDLYMKLKNKNFSIVSDDCWAGFVYKQLGLEYNTPFMWMFFRNRDYLKLIGDLPLYLNSKLEFVEIPGVNYPVGLLNDIHIYFNHYRSKEEAEAKWNKRLKKFNWDNIYFKMTTTNEEDVSEFNKILSYTKNKVSFSFDEYKFPSNVSMSGWRNPDIRKRYVGFYQYLHLHSNDYFNYVDWLNGKSNNK